MPNSTPNIDLQKPLESESADISVLNENMDKIDLALGDLTSVPTAANDVAGAIAELHDSIQEIDVHIPNGSVTPEKLSFDPATQAELDAHINSTNVHGATSAATANRFMMRDANGRAKVASPAANDDIARLDTLLNKFGAASTTGVLDWNDVSNTQPGTGNTLLRGNALNGPGSSEYFYALNLEYGPNKNGQGNTTQLAIPYSISTVKSIFMRSRYQDVWTTWVRILTDANAIPTVTNETTGQQYSMHYSPEGLYLKEV